MKNRNEQSVMFSSRNDDWETPQYLFDHINTEYHFTGDAAASSSNTKTPKFFDKDQDGLIQDWKELGTTIWLNPPYGRNISKWLEKAYLESCKGLTIVCLIPARTETNWWHTWCLKAKEIWFLKGRLKFQSNTTSWNGRGNSAPFPSAIVVFYGYIAKREPHVYWVSPQKEEMWVY